MGGRLAVRPGWARGAGPGVPGHHGERPDSQDDQQGGSDGTSAPGLLARAGPLRRDGMAPRSGIDGCVKQWGRERDGPGEDQWQQQAAMAAGETFLEQLTAARETAGDCALGPAELLGGGDE